MLCKSAQRTLWSHVKMRSERLLMAPEVTQEGQIRMVKCCISTDQGSILTSSLLPAGDHLDKLILCAVHQRVQW